MTKETSLITEAYNNMYKKLIKEDENLKPLLLKYLLNENSKYVTNREELLKLLEQTYDVVISIENSMNLLEEEHTEFVDTPELNEIRELIIHSGEGIRNIIHLV